MIITASIVGMLGLVAIFLVAVEGHRRLEITGARSVLFWLAVLTAAIAFEIAVVVWAYRQLEFPIIRVA